MFGNVFFFSQSVVIINLFHCSNNNLPSIWREGGRPIQHLIQRKYIPGM